ncbi:hypothetical protein NA57DRAFT_53952 [Rhizodiscina lignyota]|uniref:DUF6594 domain-containing protein n=1 Tax=Rhizodiscina lignyota TaxID=1504668 RepID=A0A9P4ILA2_9PEZI|nr:hypothetical protein NA57DRAFT_53952 [Rhizodiscina lignyota]
MADSGATVLAEKLSVSTVGDSETSSSATPISPGIQRELSSGSRNPTSRRSSASSLSNSSRHSQWTSADSEKVEPRRHSESSASATSNRHRPSALPSSSKRTSAPRTSSLDRDQGSFHPKLDRIREDRERESDQETQRGTSSKDRERDREKPRNKTRTSRRIVPAEDLGIGNGHVYRRNVRHRPSNGTSLQRQFNSIANASLVSVLTSLTSTSGASSGSNKTVTQDSYDRGHSHRKKRSKTRRREEKDPASTASHHSSSRGQGPSVFDYMEDDMPSEYEAAYMNGTSEASWHQRPASSSGYEASEGSPEIEPRSIVVRRVSATRMDRMNSDSGISMREGTPEPGDKPSPVARHDSAVEHNGVDDDESNSDSDSDEDGDETQLTDVSQFQVSQHDEDLHLREQLQEKEEQIKEHILQSPQPRRYHSFTRPRYDVQPGLPNMTQYPDHSYSLQHSYTYPQPIPRPSLNGSTSYPPYSQAYPYSGYPTRRASMVDDHRGDTTAKTTLAGYELLALKLSEQTGSKHMGVNKGEEEVTPLYRRFEFLNHRILLHLQDEIAELEEELRRIDEAIAQRQQHVQNSMNAETAKSSDESTPRIAASRRDDARAGGELCERRTMLLGRIYNKLAQYNKAMAAYTTAKTNLNSATQEELQSYRTWMEANVPIDKVETRFLDFDADLVSIGNSHRRDPPVAPVETAQQSADLTAPAQSSTDDKWLTPSDMMLIFSILIAFCSCIFLTASMFDSQWAWALAFMSSAWAFIFAWAYSNKVLHERTKSNLKGK